MKIISIIALGLLLGEGSAAPWDSFFNQGDTMSGGDQNWGGMPGSMSDSQNSYQPQQNDSYMPQQNESYMPQQRDNYMPQQNESYMPQQNESYMPQQRDNYMPQQNNNMPQQNNNMPQQNYPQQNRPEQGNNYQPQQNQPQQNQPQQSQPQQNDQPQQSQPQQSDQPQQSQPQQSGQPQQGSGGDGQCNKLGSMPNKYPFQVEMNKNAPGIPKGQCTEWADGRYYQLTGTHALFNGDAHRWNELAQGKSGWTVSNTPSVPSIVVIEQNSNGSGYAGHVAVVESMNGDTFCTSNWNSPTLGGLTFKSMKVGPGISFIKYNGN